MKSGLEAISKQFCEIELAIEQLLSKKGWSTEECEIILGGDFNTNIDGDKYKDLTSIYKKTKRDSAIDKAKCESFINLMQKFQVSDAYRHYKNSKLYADKPGYTYNPRRVTSNPSRLDYFLVSNSTINYSEELLVKT